MHADFINPFITATLNVLRTMASVDPVAEKPVVKSTAKTWGIVSGIIGMASDKVTGNLVISFDEGSILRIVSNMLGEEFTSVNNDVVDAVGEITNMVSGGAKKIFSESGLGFNMASPMMIVGRDVELRQLSEAPIISIPFSIQGGKFVVEANLAKRHQ